MISAPFYIQFKFSSRSGVSEEHVMGPSMSVCLSRSSQELGNPRDPRSLLEHIVAAMTSDHIIATMILDTVVAFVPLLHLISWFSCWRQRPWCGVKNIFGISLYSKEYTFPIVSLFQPYFE
jgi:hypothetical protein